MPLDRDIAALLKGAPEGPSVSAEALPAMREGMAALGRVLPKPSGLEALDLDAEGVPVRLYRSMAGPEAPPLLVFLHGGGWMLGDLDSHDAMCRQVCAHSGCAVLAVGYRLAPEHPFPAGLEDSHRAFVWARREAGRFGCDPERVALGGESAGANLTAAVCVRLRKTGVAQPLFQLLVYPPTDLNFTFPSITQVEGPGLSPAFLSEIRDLYLGPKGDADHPEASPYLAPDHSGLAPAIVVTAELDPLRDDGEFYAARLAAAGVEALVQRLAGLPHGFIYLPGSIPAVERAFRLIGALVRRYFRSFDCVA